MLSQAVLIELNLSVNAVEFILVSAQKTRRGMLNLFLSEGIQEDEPTLPLYLATLSPQHNTHVWAFK
jgi:hypothetical protein